MEAKLFDDLNKIQRQALKADGESAVGSPLSKIVLKHATQQQAKGLLSRFPDLYKVSRAKKITSRARKDLILAPLGAEHVPDSSVVRETFVLGGLGHEEAAKQECMQFKHPNALSYMSAIFPDPRDHKVTVKVESATPKLLDEPANPVNPWAIEVTLAITGPIANAKSYMQKFADRARMRVVA